MASHNFKNITVVGVGLLGGSLGLAAKAAAPRVRVVGVGHRSSSLDEALASGAVDQATLDLAQGVRGADLVVLCTPVGRFEGLLRQMAPALTPGTVVTDVGSTKARVVRLGEKILAGRALFVGSHPMAGSERRGPTYARADLYAKRLCILTPTARTDPAALARVQAFWRSIGMETVQLSPGGHDKALARVSHLPHALAALLMMVQKPDELDLAGPGFIDCTRIAGGDPVMWRDIFLTNRESVLKALDAITGQLATFRELVDRADARRLEQLLRRAQRRRAEMLQQRMRQGRMEG